LVIKFLTEDFFFRTDMPSSQHRKEMHCLSEESILGTKGTPSLGNEIDLPREDKQQGSRSLYAHSAYFGKRTVSSYSHMLCSIGQVGSFFLDGEEKGLGFCFIRCIFSDGSSLSPAQPENFTNFYWESWQISSCREKCHAENTSRIGSTLSSQMGGLRGEKVLSE
jgi:hypothetical protein